MQIGRSRGIELAAYDLTAELSKRTQRSAVMESSLGLLAACLDPLGEVKALRGGRGCGSTDSYRLNDTAAQPAIHDTTAQSFSASSLAITVLSSGDQGSFLHFCRSRGPICATVTSDIPRTLCSVAADHCDALETLLDLICPRHRLTKRAQRGTCSYPFA